MRLQRRFEKLGYLRDILTDRKEEYAALMTQEMGKPITQSRGEIDRCISHLQYYIENTERFLEDEELSMANQAQTGLITHQPLGPTLGKHFDRLDLACSLLLF